MERIDVAGHTEVLVGGELPEPLLPPRRGRDRAAILTQPAVTTMAGRIAARLEEEGLATEVIGLPDRDEAKTLEVAGSVYEALARFGLARGDTVVGVGGGAVTDLAGYVAGTWLRGVEVVHIPTTLLGAVDASIGGKTGINLAGKNLVGVFWHPSRVIVDTTVIASLPAYLRREGMAEAYKSALIGDPELCVMLSRHGLTTPLEEVIARAIRVKAEIVSRDERETGERAFLNFGHTIGHAIEFASPLSHGECVAVGMVAASVISEKLLGFADVDQVVSTIGFLDLPTSVSGLDLARVLDLLRHDKKRDSGGLRMVLLAAIGEPVLEHVGQTDIEVGLTAIGL